MQISDHLFLVTNYLTYQVIWVMPGIPHITLLCLCKNSLCLCHIQGGYPEPD